MKKNIFDLIGKIAKSSYLIHFLNRSTGTGTCGSVPDLSYAQPHINTREDVWQKCLKQAGLSRATLEISPESPRTSAGLIAPEWNEPIPFLLEWNEPIPFLLEWNEPIPFRLEWDDHSILAGMECNHSIPVGMETVIPARMKWSFHSGRNGMPFF